MRVDEYNSFTEMRKDIADDVLRAFTGKLDGDQYFLFQRFNYHSSFVGSALIAYKGRLDDDGKIFAMGNYYPENDQLVDGDETNGYLVLDNLFGIGGGGGSAIMEELIDIADSKGMAIALETLSGATSFYERFDFEHIHFDVGDSAMNMYYYPNGKPDVLRDPAAASLSRKTYIGDRTIAQAAMMTIAEML